jgi:hypothetical protein
VNENYVSAEVWALKEELLFPIQQNLVAQALQEHDGEVLRVASRDTSEPLNVLWHLCCWSRGKLVSLKLLQILDDWCRYRGGPL